MMVSMLRNLSIATKSFVAPVLLAVVMIGIAGLFFITYRTIEHGNARAAEAAEAIERTRQFIAALDKGHTALYRAISLKSQTVERSIVHRVKLQAMAAWDRADAQLAELDLDRVLADRSLLEKARLALAAYIHGAKRAADFVEEDAFTATMYLNGADKKYLDAQAAASDIAAALNAEHERIERDADDELSGALHRVGIATAVAILLSLTAALGVARLVAGQVRAAAALQATEVRLRQMMDNLDRAQRIAHMGSIVRDLATDHAECSAEVYRIFGIEPDSFVPSTENFVKFLLLEDRAKLLAADAAIANGIRPAPFEYRIRRPGGGIRQIYRETEIICNENGKPVGFAAVLQDVTEARAAASRQRELERQLQHSQKLEALGTLAGGIAHDLNNTLVPVLALSQMLLDSVAEADREDLQTIILATRRARDLVQQILAFSRKQEVRKVEIDLAEVVEQSLKMLRATLPASLMVIEEIDDVPRILADAGQLQQVIVNLMTNAAQAIGDATGVIRISLTPAADGLRLSIADTGRGMNEKTVERIFEPFFTTKGVGEGTGLGLSVVHGIITDHNGKIEVSSQPGKGTIFTISLPAVTAAVTPIPMVA
jgi:signal transduction histidine kinase